MRKFGILVAMGLGVTICCGCGGKYRTHTVRGQVTLQDGTPLDNVEITFQSDDPPITATAVTDARGNYALGTVREDDGAPAGTYRVAVVETEDLSDPDTVTPPRIAPRYANLHSSGLEVTVPSRDGYDLTLDSPDR